MPELTNWIPDQATKTQRYALYRCGYRKSIVSKMSFSDAIKALEMAITIHSKMQTKSLTGGQKELPVIP